MQNDKSAYFGFFPPLAKIQLLKRFTMKMETFQVWWKSKSLSVEIGLESKCILKTKMTSFSYYALALLVCGNDDRMTTGGLEQHFCLFYWGDGSQPAVLTRYPILYAIRTNLHQLLGKKRKKRNHVSFVGFGRGGKACFLLQTQRLIKLGKYFVEVYPVGRDLKVNKAVLETFQNQAMKSRERLTPYSIELSLEKIISDPKCSIILSNSTQIATKNNVCPIQLCICIVENV